MFELDRDLFVGGEVRGQVDVPEGAAAELPAQLVTVGDFYIHLTCSRNL